MPGHPHPPLHLRWQRQRHQSRRCYSPPSQTPALYRCVASPTAPPGRPGSPRHLTARRDAKAAKAFLNKAIERVRLHRPVTICTDKAQAYRRVIREINHRYDPHFDSIRHIDRKWCNNLIESDHAAMKRLLGHKQSFRSLRTAKATLSGIETIRTIKRGHIHHKKAGVMGELEFIYRLFEIAA